ncbi:hypothetical protein [Paraglaciecola marina]|uniref:hypothetical protein n=1 Tax=Paraglaciecola marina TaxID=2500157 RepID=UPI00105B958D|nr:hypothetical protein [Paraglaciecola marina]
MKEYYFNRSALTHIACIFLIYLLADIYVLKDGEAFLLTLVFLLKLFSFIAYSILPSDKLGLVGIEKFEPISYRAVADFLAICLGLWCIWVELMFIDGMVSRFVGILLLLTFPSIMVFLGRMIIYFSLPKNGSVVVPFLCRTLMMVWLILSMYFLIYGDWVWNFLEPYDFLSYMAS